VSLLDVAVAVGYPVALFVVGFVVERRLEGVEPLLAVSDWARTLAGGIALAGPWLLYWNGHFGGLGVPVEVFVPLTLSLVLWIVATRLVGVTARGDGAAC
jgi:hypothetical protein